MLVVWLRRAIPNRVAPYAADIVTIFIVSGDAWLACLNQGSTRAQRDASAGVEASFRVTAA